LFRFSPEELKKGKKVSLNKKREEKMKFILNIYNFVIFIKHDKSTDPIGIFVPTTNWRDSNTTSYDTSETTHDEDL